MNNNKNDEAALLAGCKGVFSKSSYITIGKKDKPEDYNKKQVIRDNFKGKQFGHIGEKSGRTNETYFEKKHNWISDSDKFIDRLKYNELQKEKKKGFLTGDFRKRDEFSNTVRTEQWREQLKQEDHYAKKAVNMLSELNGDLFDQEITTADVNSRQMEGTTKPFLYDLVFEKEDTSTSGASRVHRDTKNPTQLSKDRKIPELTTSLMAFEAPSQFCKPQFARKPIVRDTFYRKTNILFPSSCASTECQ